MLQYYGQLFSPLTPDVDVHDICLVTLLLPAAEADLPDWLAAPSRSQAKQVKPAASADVKRNLHKQTLMQHKPRPYAPDCTAKAASQDVDPSEAEYLLDVWDSDTDEPTATGKHRWEQFSCDSGLL